MTMRMDANTINLIQNAEERYGMANQTLNANTRIKRASQEALEECNLSTHYITDIQSSCATMWEIHIGGVLKNEEREKLVDCIAKKMNCNKANIAIIAFYD